jgi:hypothetical protein
MDVPGRESERAEPARSDEASGETPAASIVDLLLTVGYIDGVFHHREQAFVQTYIDSVLLRVEQSAPAHERVSLRAAWRAYFDDLYGRLDAEIAVLADEVISVDTDNYVSTQLRVRALTLFRGLSAQEQSSAIELIHALIHADGMITAPEQNLYQELTGYFEAAPVAAPAASAGAPTAQMRALKEEPGSAPASLIVGAAVQKDLVALSHPLLDPLEQTYSPHPVERKSQIDWDYQLIQQAVAQWQRQRGEATGRLAGLSSAAQVPVGARFLDGYVYVQRPSQPLELVVLGDLHGCYSCLKAALLQSDFIQRVWAHQWDPQRYPDVKLVLLGDYIDRGMFSFDGVLRAALHLFVSLPDHVILLRGNHEFLRSVDNRIISCVHPAEALASIAPHVPLEMLDAYRVLFEHMPTSFVCDQTLFVHGGIPRDDTFEARYKDLSSLNDAELRFQMMWSDPVKTQHVPVDLQRQNPRFSFGHSQFRSFMERTGLQTMVRGHEKIEAGFEVVYDMGEHHLLNLFSAGGHNNCDLPADSSYRSVTPMALTIRYGDGAPIATPWPLQYHTFNYQPHNGFYRPHPVLDFRYG